jgi:hypothetical protein
MWLNIFGDYTAGCDERLFAYIHSRLDDGTGTYKTAFSKSNRLGVGGEFLL